MDVHIYRHLTGVRVNSLYGVSNIKRTENGLIITHHGSNRIINLAEYYIVVIV